MMEKKPKVVQYRERLDRTLASPDLTNDEILKTLVKSQLLRSLEQEIEGYKEKVVETKTAEISNFLDMLRSASLDDGRISNTSHTDWKLKHDNEDFRVMYREGPEGTPFHTLLVEGYVDGPVDVCLCVAWETSLYKKWWPQSTVPAFKIISCDCLQKVRIGEQLSLVRMKVSWPLSAREAIVHYYLFEYFQDDLIVVLTNSVPGLTSSNGTLYGFNKEAIPEAKDVVRIDWVGGFALQKVTSERSYLRTIANMDIKLDFVPPSLINFISRQLLGNGFRLYQKAVVSMMSHDKEFSKALGDPLYARIREALYSNGGSKSMDGKELKQVASSLRAEDLIEIKQDGARDISQEDKNNQCPNNVMPMAMDAIALDNSKAFGEIAEADSEEIAQIEEDDMEVNDFPIESKASGEIVEESKEIALIEQNDMEVNDIPIEDVDASARKSKRNVYISPKVEQALETLENAISVVREYRFQSRRASSGFANEEPSFMQKGGRVDSYSTEPFQLCSEHDVSVEVSSRDMLEGTSQESPATNYDIQHFRYTGTNPNLKEVNSNKLVPTSPGRNLSRTVEASQVTSCSLENGATLDQTMCSNKQLNTDSVQDMSSTDPNKLSRQKKVNTIVPQGMSPDAPNKSSRRKKYQHCCFLH